MKKPIKNVEHLKQGDKATIVFNDGEGVYTDTVRKIKQSQTQKVSVIIQFASGYTFPVLKTGQSWVSGQIWEFKEGLRELPDIVPGTAGDGDFGGEGCPIQRIHPILGGEPDDPYVWITMQGHLMKESEVLEFTPDVDKTTQYAKVEISAW